MTQQMMQLVEPLMATLDEMIKVYRQLLEVVRREREILISSQLDDLNENNRAKETLLVKIREIEDARLREASVLAVHLGLGQEAPRLLELARHVGGELGDRLRNLHSVLELLLKRVQELNKQNETLVQSALDSVTGAMREIRETLADKPTYQRKGEVSATPAATGQLVSREA